MDRIIEKLRHEPVRVRLYGLVVLVAGYLVSKGYIGVTDAEFVGAVALAVLGVESSRSRVTPDGLPGA